MSENPVMQLVEPAPPTRPVFEYDVPDRLGGGTIGIVKLTTAEEMMATVRAGTDSAKLVYELAKQALVAVNGRGVTLADGSADRAWDTMDPAVRNLVVMAYGDLHVPQEDEVKAFRASQRVKVG